ncbi:tail fiber assembly protein, partial [Rouxiella chamberiensis]
SPLQDAKELDIATDDELSQLREWMLYRVQLSRIDPTLAPDIIWPEIPA